jgi:hypothetical protein
MIAGKTIDERRLTVQMRSFLFGVVAGTAVTAGAGVALRTVLQSQASPLRIVRAKMPVTLDNRDTFYTLRQDSRDVASIVLRDGKLQSIMVWSPQLNRAVMLSARNGIFPSALMIEHLRASNPKDATMTVMDDDLDGVPDRRMDWESEKLFERSGIEWILEHRSARPEENSGEK